MNRLPIRVRVTAAFALAMALVLAVSGLFLYARLGDRLSNALTTDLRLRAQDLAALVNAEGSSLPQTGSGRFIEHGESYAQLLTPTGAVVDASQPLGSRSLLTAAQIAAGLHRTITLERRTVPGLNEPSRLLATPVERGGRRLVLVVGATLQNRAETLADFRRELLLALPGALGLACLAGYLLAGASLRQVEAMRRRAAAISAETPGERLPVPQTGDELERLGNTLNEMLDRLEAALDRERDFVADAGHELRTPLALLRTELELALRQAQSADELREAVRYSSGEAERLSQLAEDLLLIARSDRGRLPLRLEPLTVDEVFADVLSRFEWRSDGEGRLVRAAAESGLALIADRVRVEQALGNLVDNALRYGGNEIRLEAVREDGIVQLHVRDNGSGFPQHFLEHAFDRFSRADAARTSPGSGLGLAIVRTIAEAHGGHAGAANAPMGGADVWLSLPAAGA